ncbi:MAG TPA: hypothetical protein VGM06_22735 [Polyangiaceae bacterium]|jgi:hypothetical protein
MPNSLHSRLNDLASSFASAVLDAVRGASLRDLHSGGSVAEPRGRRGAPKAVAPARSAGGRSAGRLPRRSAEDIAGALDSVVALVKKHKDGMRAEEIRKELGMQAKEMPRILKEGLSARVLRTKGQKRATTYFAK